MNVLVGTATGEKKVLWLEVSVHDTELMAMVQHVHHLAKYARRFALGVRAGFDDRIKQLATHAHLHDDMHKVLVFVRRLHMRHLVKAGKL